VEIGQVSAKALELKATAARFLEEEIWPFERELASAHEVDRDRFDELRRKARAAGFVNLNMPVEAGGLDLSVLDQVALQEEAGKATNGLGFMLGGRGPRQLYESATPYQLERYVMPVLRGDTRTAWAITEPGAGSDLGGLQATAVREGDEWVLNGEKWFITGGDRADFFIFLARTDHGETLFLVDQGTPGFDIVRTPRFMHDPYTSKHVELSARNCRVPERNRVQGRGADDTRNWISDERLMIAARCCGAAERLIGIAREWALERRAFGHAIAEYQGIQFMLADSLTELMGARLLTWHAATAWDRKQDPKIVHGKIAMAKLSASEMAGRVADRAVQIFGGRGYMTDNPAERYYRELRVDRIWEGTSEIQRVIISRGLFKRGVERHLA
jgi:acyl-CoA dehydrogenase